MITITFNGCFGTGLHPGHLFFIGYALAHARDYRDAQLIVGINSDDYIRRTKGYEPMPAEERAKQFMQLGIITRVEVFSESNPIEFIRRVHPDVHCTGEEYMGRCPEQVVCEELGIKLCFVPRIGEWSTRKMLGITMETKVVDGKG